MCVADTLPSGFCLMSLASMRGHLYVTRYTEGFSHFVSSMTAPVASGWSVRRVGPAPTGKRRLLTAHAMADIPHRRGKWVDVGDQSRSRAFAPGPH